MRNPESALDDIDRGNAAVQRRSNVRPVDGEASSRPFSRLAAAYEFFWSNHMAIFLMRTVLCSLGDFRLPATGLSCRQPQRRPDGNSAGDVDQLVPGHLAPLEQSRHRQKPLRVLDRKLASSGSLTFPCLRMER
jgi:hypothetical protein